MEIIHCRNAIVSFCIVDDILVDDSSKYKCIYKSAVFREIDIVVRCDSASVPYDSSSSGSELSGKRIRNMSYASVFIAVRIVDCLDASSARRLIFRRSDLHLSIVRQRLDGLYQTLSVASLSHDCGPVHILERSGYNLR